MRSTITAYGFGWSIAVPPSFTYSASTPSSRRFTSSMNAGGKDHSLPTSRPIFSMRFDLVWDEGQRVSESASQRVSETGPPVHRSIGPPSSVMPPDVLHDHLLPVRPVVCPAVPDSQRMPDALRVEA